MCTEHTDTNRMSYHLGSTSKTLNLFIAELNCQFHYCAVIISISSPVLCPVTVKTF